MNIVTLPELAQNLLSLGYPVAYSHFSSVQTLPFITYIETAPTLHKGDDVVQEKTINIDIELYSKNKDSVAESKIEKLLNDNEIPYGISPLIYIDDEKIFQRVFSIALI